MSEQRPQQPSLVRLATKNGPLAQIWLASTLTNLNRSYLKTDILQSVQEISKVTSSELDDTSVEPITLRVSGELLHGVVRVYSQKANFLLSDISDLLHKLKSVFRGNVQKSIMVHVDTVSKLDQLILQDTVTEMDVLITPSLDFLRETSIPQGLMGREHSMERQVQGANAATAPWDMSLEVGRRFAPDDDLEQQTSQLDLNFELGDTNNSKSWGEGTHMSDQFQISLGDDNKDELPSDNDSMDWDLGVVEQESSGADDGNKSVELGRRATHDTALHDTTDFDFDLGIEKDPFEATLEQELREPEPKVLEVRHKRNSALVNAKRLQQDEETELKEFQVKNGLLDAISASTSTDVSNAFTKKRGWSELVSSMDFLPEYSINHFSAFTFLKKQKRSTDTHPEAFEKGSIPPVSEDPSMDLSLELDESLVHQSDIEAGTQEGIEATDQSGIEEPGQLISDLASGPADLHEYSHISSDNFSISNGHTQKVELNTGELVSKSTVDMANAIRNGFIGNEDISFDQLLNFRYRASETPITKSQAGKAFFELLVLATADCINLEQKASDDIRITSKGALFEKFIEV
ncbi:kleisin alpha Ecym_5290 [Eremothecium cymbalariae DBVPG|uniref:Rad21/Rec8-like protein N-terminal domain-containing protein n=1 Tax=Eremothecium cymbalariae (strain CBS 270.75 / DBVPG 7215 / KCTC 17166 / NRRL Y-17582) TaxID=931890 RepID=I6NDB0_ERECY|nr:hypothetical protein Ecym_5290 [Eremothecium cymbalariae DBVPG\